MTEWFWVYMGFNNVAKKAIFYVKWAEREDSHVWEGVETKLAANVYITVGGEGKLHSGWNGRIKDTNFVWGPGAFRDRNWDELMAAPLSEAELENGVE